jgi:hypothetical protein
VAMVVVYLSGILIDEGGGDVVGQNHRAGSRRRTELAFDFIDADVVQRRAENRVVLWHKISPRGYDIRRP